MKKVLAILASLITTGGLIAGCTPGNNVPGSTAAGAVAGGLAGGLLFQGSAQPVGIIGGALLGGIIGNQIGQRMDAQDRAYMQNAIIYTPVHETYVWTNSRRGVTYRVMPTHAYYTRNGRYCREYRTRTYVNGVLQQTAYGRACHYPNGGAWETY